MNTKVKSENFIVIQGYMVSEMKLKGNELLVYAIINGFSQEERQVFNGSLQYLADWTNSTKQGIMKNLKSLVEKGYIGKNEKIINGVKFCEYYVTKFRGVLNKVEGGMQQSLIGGSKQSCTNKIDINNKDNNIEEKIENIYTPSIPSIPNNEDEILKSEFEKLWALYPNKKGKDKAFSKYKKYRTSKNDDYTTYEEVLKGLERYLSYIKQNTWYSPKNGVTWFSNKCWNDEYEIREERVFSPEELDKFAEVTDYNWLD
jgi:hypothetical protein